MKKTIIGILGVGLIIGVVSINSFAEKKTNTSQEFNYSNNGNYDNHRDNNGYDSYRNNPNYNNGQSSQYRNWGCCY